MDKAKHFVRECSMKEKTCNVFETKGHVAKICQKEGGGGGANAAGGSGSGGAAKSIIPITARVAKFRKRDQEEGRERC